MRHLFILFMTLTVLSCSRNEEREIATELDYFPEQRQNVSDKTYRKWTILLGKTYEKVKANNNHFSNVDHLNIASSFIELKEPKQKVLDQFYLAQQNNLESTAEVFSMIYSKDRLKGYLTNLEYDAMISNFDKLVANTKKEIVDVKQYSEQGGYDYDLVKLMAHLLEQDQKYRPSYTNEQELIDIENSLIVDSLYTKNNQYIGQTLVGDRYMKVMSIIIQHSSLVRQERYLPIIQQAVIDNEIPASVLKLLIDRVYNKKFAYQIFGTQSGVDIADNKTIASVKSEYGL